MGRIITVRIINEGGSGEPNPDISSAESARSEGSKPSKPTPQKSQTALAFIMFAKQSKDLWLDTLKNESQYFFGKFLQQEEDYRAQVGYRNAMTTISMASSMAKSIVAGAMVGGPVGAVVGAIAEASRQTIGLVDKYFDSEEKIVNQSYSNYYYGKRAGLIDGGKGTEN